MSTELMEAPQGALMARESTTEALANMGEDEFEQRIASLKQGLARVRRIKAELMQAGSHYGVIPGTEKPTLLKPGAEALCSVYHLRANFVPHTDFGDGLSSPAVAVTMRCELHHEDLAGPAVAVGYGQANSWEKRYRYRKEGRTCPECGGVGTVIKGKEEYGGGWLCWAKQGGCGAKFQDDAEAITGQVVGQLENPDPYDLANTLLKMAEKRAFVDATLRATASSDLFTQDLEDTQASPRPAPQPERQSEPQKSGKEGFVPQKADEDPVALGNELMARCDGDADRAADLLQEITKGDKPGKDGQLFKGFRSIRGLKHGWQVEKAWRKLREMDARAEDDAEGYDGTFADPEVIQ